MSERGLLNSKSDNSLQTSQAVLVLRAKQRAQLRRIPFVRLLIIAVVLGLWEIGTKISLSEDHLLIDPFLFSQPSKIVVRIWQWLFDGTIVDNIFITLYEAAMGFLIGMVSGVAVGFLLGCSDYWARVFKPIIQGLNAVPRLVFAPLLFVIFGLGVDSKIALGALVIFFIAFWNAFQGVREVDRNIYNNARMLGATGNQMTRHVLLPAALTWIVSSLHLAIGFAMSAAIVAEYLGSTRGLGNVIAKSEGTFDQTGVLAGLVVLSAVVIVVEMLVSIAERRLWKWKPTAAGDLLAP